MPALLWRILTCLLVVRVIAAPVTLKSAHNDHRSSTCLMVRVCAWPAWREPSPLAKLNVEKDRMAKCGAALSSSFPLVTVPRAFLSSPILLMPQIAEPRAPRVLRC